LAAEQFMFLRKASEWSSMSRRFFQLGSAERFLLLEAGMFLAFSAACIAILPFRAVGTLAGRASARRPISAKARAATRGQVRWAVEACARRVPWKAVCFQQGLSAHLMLRRRGIASTLCYGASLDPSRGLVAHVWVRDGEVDVIGGEDASRFEVFARFPALA